MSETIYREEELRALAMRLEFPVHNVKLFDHALTHSSLAAEGGEVVGDYEALEFLGDAVLGLAAAHHLFLTIPDRTPGEYSRMRAGLVNRKCVARVADVMGLAPVVRLGKGEERAGGRYRASLASDCLEALIGAIYLDSGWEIAREFVVRMFHNEFEQAPAADLSWDYKSRLQQFCQGQKMPLPRFDVVRAEGPDHNKWFEVEVYVCEQAAGRGAGKSKKEAEQHAAHEALLRHGQLGTQGA